MTTQIPTSKNPLNAGDVNTSGMPDLSALTQLANELFQALPGASDIFTNNLAPRVPVNLPAPPSGAAPNFAGSPISGFSPSAIAPDFRSPLASAGAGSPVASLPQSAPVSAPSSPYYFLGEASAYSAPLESITGLDEPSPQAFGLPTQADLIALLADDSRVANTGRFANPAGGAAPAAPAPTSANNYNRTSSPADGVDRVSAQSFGLPGTPEVNQLVRSQPRFAPPETAAPANNNFYFLDSNSSGWDQRRETSPAKAGGGVAGFDVQAIRRDFPILSESVNGRPLVWFDNAATTQKPKSVIDRVSYFYEHENSNIHRAAHELAARATDAYEGARQKVARFIGAKSTSEIIFVRGATEAINLLANTYGRQNIGEGDEIIVSLLEHHANIVPWHRLASEVGAKLRVIPVDDSGQILLDEYRKLFNSRTKIVAVTQVSNALGTVTPIKEIIDLAHAAGVPVMVDGAQSVSHIKVDVQALDADFFVFSGHKVFGPTGIGVIYGKAEFLKNMQPYQGGGNMIADVTFDRIVYQDAPNRFEAGTGNIADAVGLGAAIDYVERIGMDRIARYEHDLLEYATYGLRSIRGVRLIGTAVDKASVASFVLEGYKTEEVGGELNREGIAVRSGHHCAQPILRRFGVETTVRPSLAFYNTCEEIDLMILTVNRLARARR